TVMTTAQVSRPDAIREACALSPRSTGPDSSGTTTLASAPPATTSNTTFGTWFAVTYAVARQVWPAVWPRTNTRANPAILARMVTTPMTTAAPASPLAN